MTSEDSYMIGTDLMVYHDDDDENKQRMQFFPNVTLMKEIYRIFDVSFLTAFLSAEKIKALITINLLMLL
jgi:hypothetical protein